MQDVQKKTYLKLIMSEIYSNDAFCAKSITLDFMYQFNNPCLAMLSLTDILNYNTCIAKIGLNCIYGIVLAVQDYFKYSQKVIMSKFTKTLIDGVAYRIDDVSLDNYEDCMSGIMGFITQNADFNLLYPYFELIRSFRFSDLSNEKNKNVFRNYCEKLRRLCDRLSKENNKLFLYKLNSMKNLYESYREETYLKDFIDVIKDFSDEIVDQIYFFSNNCAKSAELETQLRRDFGEKVVALEKNELDNTEIQNHKFIFILDFEHEDSKEMLYYLGKLEGILQTNKHFFAVFFGCTSSYVQETPIIKEITGKYVKGDSSKDTYRKIVDFVER